MKRQESPRLQAGEYVNMVGLSKRLMTGIADAAIGLWLFQAIALLESMAFDKTVMGLGEVKLAAMMGGW